MKSLLFQQYNDSVDAVQADLSQSDTIENVQNRPIDTETIISPKIVLPTVSLKPFKNADSLFNVLERKEKEAKRIQQRLFEKNAEKEQSIPETMYNLPRQLQSFDSNYVVSPFHNNKILESNKPISNTILFSEKNQDLKIIDIFKPIKPSPYPADFFLGVIFFVFLIILFVKTLFNRYYTGYFQTAFNYQLSFKLLRDKNVFQSRFNLILNLIYLVVISIFIYQILFYFNKMDIPDKRLFFYIITVFLTITVSRYIVLTLVGEIFNAQKLYKEYIFHLFMYNKILGLVLTPIVFIIQYIPDNFRTFFVAVGLLLITVSVFIKLFRGFTIIVKKDVLLFYVILYLCTLEILPILIGYTYIKRMI